MDGRRDIQERTFVFALNVTRLCKELHCKQGPSKLLANQLLRSGTSVGANVEEAQAGQSRADFVSKYSIALKEIREAHYWLRLLAESAIVDGSVMQPLIAEADELKRILGAIVSRTKRKS